MLEDAHTCGLAPAETPQTVIAQFLTVCRRSKMVAMGTRRPRRGSRLCRRWALKWREDGELLGQCLRATKCAKLSDDIYMLHTVPRYPGNAIIDTQTGRLPNG